MLILNRTQLDILEVSGTGGECQAWGRASSGGWKGHHQVAERPLAGQLSDADTCCRTLPPRPSKGKLESMDVLED